MTATIKVGRKRRENETSPNIVASKDADHFSIAIQLDEQPFFHILVRHGEYQHGY